MIPEETAGSTARALSRRVAGGVKWTAGAQLIVQALVMVRIVVLARLLAPAEFGKFALVAVFFTVANLLSESGLGASLIQRRELSDRDLHTTFWLQLGLAVSSGLLLAAIGPALAAFFNEPELGLYCLALGATIAFGTWTSVHWALLQRQMRFREIAIRQVAATAFGLGVSIAVATVRHDAWALIAGTASTVLISNAAVVLMTRWRPAFQFDKASARASFGFSSHLLGFQLVATFTRHGDNVLVGRILGASALGIYTRGYQVLLYPLRQVSNVIGRVMFPALSSIQSDLDRLRSAYLRAVGVIVLLTYPALTGVLLVAPDFVLVVLGDQWRPVIPLVRLFALAGLVESVTAPVGWVYQALGRTKLQLVVGTSVAVFILAGVWVAAAIGSVTAVAATYALMTLFWAGPALLIPCRLLGARLRDVGAVVAGPALCSAGMAVVVSALQLSTVGLTPTSRLPITAIGGAVTYIGLALALRPPAMNDVMENLKRSKA